MDQYELLLKYQQVDMELDQYEKEMRGNSNRKELLKHRDFLLEQQNVLKKIENDVEIMGDRMEALADEIGKNYAVRVATSDALVQLSSLRSGVLRMSAKELRQLLEDANKEMQQHFRK